MAALNAIEPLPDIIAILQAIKAAGALIVGDHLRGGEGMGRRELAYRPRSVVGRQTRTLMAPLPELAC